MTIDWLNVVYNALWLLGLAIILAAFSYTDWQAHTAKQRLRDLLNAPPFQAALNSGLILVSLSLALLADVWWERLIWIVFIGLFAVQLALLWRGSKSPPKNS